MKKLILFIAILLISGLVNAQVKARIDTTIGKYLHQKEQSIPRMTTPIYEFPETKTTILSVEFNDNSTGFSIVIKQNRYPIVSDYDIVSLDIYYKLKYQVIDGKIKLVKRVQGNYIPEQIIPEKLTFPEE